MTRKATGLIALFIIIFTHLHAQSEDTFTPTDKENRIDTSYILLNDILIEENRIRIPFSETNRSISIILKERLERQPIHSLAEALSGIAGVDIRSRGVTGTQADISIRGSTFDENLVLLNGVKLSDSQTGHHLMNLPINFLDVERVEVLKGGAARIFGQNAYSGAINVITKMPEERKITFSAYGGLGPSDSREIDSINFYGHGVSLGISLPGNTYSQYISYGNDKSNGHRYNSHFEMNNMYYRSALELGQGKLHMQAGYSWREFGANGFYFGIDEVEKVNTGVFSLEYEGGNEKIQHRQRVYWRRNKDNYTLDKDSPETFHNVHLTNAMGAESHWTISSGFGLTGIGAEIRLENIRGVEEEQLASNALLADDDRVNIGIYAEHRYEKGRFSMTPGIYVNSQNEYGLSAFPGIDLGFVLTPAARLYANAGRTYRVPTFFDLHYSSNPARTFGDPNLKPGIANNYELGMKFKSKYFVGELNGFIVDSKTMIDWVNDPSDSEVTWQAMNFDNVNKYGIEAAIAFDLKRAGNLYLEWIELNYTYVNSDIQDSDFKSRYATNNLRHQANMILTHKLAGPVKNSISARYRSRPDVSDADIIDGIERFNNYLLLDTRVFYELNKGMIYLEGTNLLNHKYVEVGTVVMPGRWFRAGLIVSLNY